MVVFIGCLYFLSDTCWPKNYTKKCDWDEVILMKTARLGRLKRKSVCSSLHYDTGCTVNALKDLNLLCSGRRECSFPVSSKLSYDRFFEECHVQNKDVMPYLETFSECIRGIHIA